MYLVVFWSKLYTSVLYLLLITLFVRSIKIIIIPVRSIIFYTVIWDLLSTYRYYWVHPGDVSDLYVLNFVYVQNSAQTYYVFNNVLPEEGTQSASIKVTTL